MKQRITYYVGLHAPGHENHALEVQARAVSACNIFADAYDAITLTKSIGMWGGIQEPTMVAVVLTDEHDAAEQAREIAQNLCLTLEQDAILYTIEPVEFHIVTG